MFITFEGADGSGKTTALKKLEHYLQTKQVAFVLTREPGFKESWASREIRKIIVQNSSDISAMTEAILFAADRRLHLERIIWPALKAQKIVLCDRYFDSSFAYQGKARNLGMQKIISLNENISDHTYPDLTIYFDLPLAASLKRVEGRGAKNRLDSESILFHQKVHEGYAELIKMYPDRYIVINALQSPEAVFNDLKEIFKTRVLNQTT